jgi:A/G-specific adenine glycosylase
MAARLTALAESELRNMAESAAHVSKRAESQPAGRVPNSQAVALRANSLFDMVPRFRHLVRAHYKKYGRHDLPWRKTKDPYKILVSEVMLQQTQVERVIPFYKNFLKKFPNVRVLAEAPLSEVLQSWQGLGYNRRAKMLNQAAKDIKVRFKGGFPKSIEEIESLPGIGPYTARAIAAFAYNQDVVFVETNIRTAIIHYFFNKNTPIYGSISDMQIQEILEKLLPQGRAREWYSALMDYGAYLKHLGISHNARTQHYVKQSKFAGSLREVRGAILRELVKGSRIEAHLARIFGTDRIPQVHQALQALSAEGLIQKRGKAFALPR